MLQRFILPRADVGSGIAPSSGAQLFFYEPGTSTLKGTFTDVNGIIPSANPVIANSKGVFDSIYLSGVYKVILKDKNGAQIWEESAVQYDYSFDSASEAALVEFAADGAAVVDAFETDSSSALTQFESDAETAIAAAGYQIVGDFADVSKVTINNPNEVYTSQSVANLEDAVWRYIDALPYTPTGSDPTQAPEDGKWQAVAIGELKSIARSLNIADTDITYSTAGLTLASYVYDSSNQTTWAVPADAQGEVIVSVLGSALVTSGGSYTLQKALPNPNGVNLSLYGGLADSATDNVLAFESAADVGVGGTIIVNKPYDNETYYLSSDPSLPLNLHILASPSWFSGTGKLPFHNFVSLSEGLDPRAFNIPVIGYTETVANETERKWGVVGWVNNKNSPQAGYEGTLTDAVGVDGRGVASAANARSWGVVGLGQLDAGVSGVAQAYAAEFDINNNYQDNTQDSANPAKCVVMVSGGQYKPEVANFIQATKTPNNGLGDNRFFNGLRFYQDSCLTANIYIDDFNTCDAIRIPKESQGVHWTANANLVNYYMKIDQSNNHLSLSIDSNQSFDILNSAAQKTVTFGESSTDFEKPVGASTRTEFSLPASLNAGISDVVTIGASGTITGGITGGVDGQTITIINASGGSSIINRNANMRTNGGIAVTLNDLQVVQFILTGGTYFQVSTPTANA